MVSGRRGMCRFGPGELLGIRCPFCYWGEGGEAEWEAGGGRGGRGREVILTRHGFVLVEGSVRCNWSVAVESS